MASISLQAVYDQARQSLESNDLERAIGLAQHILDHYPDNLEAYRILGEAYLATRQFDRAQESFERVLRSDPENIPAHVGLGITSERQNQIDRAINEFEQALEIKPDMTELRSQLLRLYTEGWGSENAQLRLSRAGLARLYAKGHMLPQAIAEFRQVLADQPGRHDTMVALAEALWRDGQEDEAIELCRDIVASRPESLKANLLLGYLLLSSGRPEGERYWQAAQRMDPYNAVARALFDTMPQEDGEEPTIEAWDEAAWRAQRAAAQQEQIAATRPMEAVTPVGTSATGGFFDTVVERPATPAGVSAASDTFSEADDFLASLLSMDMPTSPPPIPPVDLSEKDLDLEMRSFGAEEPAAPAAEEPAAAAPAEEPAAPAAEEPATAAPAEEPASVPETTPAADEPAITPFSLSELGLSDEEIASVESAAPAADEPTITPFSLSELGLSDEEIAGLESLEAEPERSAPPQLPAMPSTSSESKPGSEDSEDSGALSDLPVDLKPFSIDELDLGGEARAGSMGLPPSLQPFSLDDSPPQRPRVSGFTAPESAENENIAEDEETPPETRGFSWQQASQKSQTDFGRSARADTPAEESSIFAKLKQQRVSQSEPPPLPPVSLSQDEHLGLFSVDDIPLREDAEAAKAEPAETPPAAPASQESTAAPEIEDLQSAVESGQVQPFSLADLGLTPEEIAALEGGDIGSTAPEQPIEPAAEQPQEPTVDAPGSTAPTAGQAAGEEETLTINELTPFSLADLGLSDEEIGALGLGAAEAEESDEVGLGLTEEELEGLDGGDLKWLQSSPAPAPSSGGASGEPQQVTSGDLVVDRLIALGRQQGYVDIADIIANVDDPEAETDRIEEIGRRLHEARVEIRDGDEVVDMDADEAEEAGAAEQGEPAAEPPEPEVRPAFSRDLDLMTAELEIPKLDQGGAGETQAAEPAAPAEPDMTPFSLSELGLTDEEISSLGLSDIAGSAQPAEAAPEAPAEEPDMTPFSLSELGLSEEEIAALGLGDVPTPAQPAEAAPAAPEASAEEPDMTPFSLSELGLSEEEIAAFGLDAGVATPEPATEEGSAEPPPVAEAPAMTPPAPPEASEAISAAEPPPVAEAPAMTPPAPPEAPAAPLPAPRPATPPPAIDAGTGNEVLDAFVRRLQAEPENDVLRLSVARVSGQVGRTDLAVNQYKYLIKHNRLLNDIVQELQELIEYSDDRQERQRLHRLLGDVYTRQGRLQEAIDAYSWRE